MRQILDSSSSAVSVREPIRSRARRTARYAATAIVLSLLAASGWARQDPASRQERVRQAAMKTYVHGMTEEIALEEFGPGAVPILIELLADPAFPRRDNVIAVLGYLGGGAATDAILNHLRRVPAPLTIPEEDRALLLAPQSLGQIASRGEARALEALMAMTAPGGNGGVLTIAASRAPRGKQLRDDLLEMALRGLAYTGLPEARARLDAIAQAHVQPAHDGRDLRRAAQAALVLHAQLHTSGSSQPPAQTAGRPATDGDEAQQDRSLSLNEDAPSLPTVADVSHSTVHVAMIDFVNHVDVPTPMTAEELDDRLDRASLRMGAIDYSGDVMCCAGMQRTGPAGQFGSTGDGLDIIDSSEEIASVLSNPSARFKVVRAINYCGGNATNIIGCAWVGARGAAVVRFGGFDTEAMLWAHEYGHNTGLSHNTGSSHYIMYPSLNGTNFAMTQVECDQYHDPAAGAAVILDDAGACTDADQDQVQDWTDNCPAVANAGQEDSDGDGIGDLCENGCGNGLLDAGEACDGLDLGGESCESLGYDGGALICRADCSLDESGCTQCGNGVLEPGEDCDDSDFGSATCADQGCSTGVLACDASCGIDDTGCADCALCDNDGVCDPGEDCTGCPVDCPGGAGASCGNGVCEAADGESCVTCAQDCHGKQNGSPASRFCCGDGGGDTPVPCMDPRCTDGEWSCTNSPAVPSCCGDQLCEAAENGYDCPVDCGQPPTCGDGNCDPGEDSCWCGQDCGMPDMQESICDDGTDQDCDGLTDCSDSDCNEAAACVCLPAGASCSSSDQCCSSKCNGRQGSRTCR